MKSLTTVCLALWLVLFAGSILAPQVFCTWYVHWPVFSMLCILLPYGFAKSLQGEPRRRYSEVFLLVFLLGVFANAMVTVGVSGVGSSMAIPSRDLPESLSVEAVDNDSAKVRLMAARAIYVEYGQPIVFRDADNTLKQYVPTEEDRIHYQEGGALREQAKEVRTVVERRVEQSVFSLGLACISFFVVFFWAWERGGRRRGGHRQS